MPLSGRFKNTDPGSEAYRERVEVFRLMGMAIGEHADYEKAWLEVFYRLKESIPEYVAILEDRIVIDPETKQMWAREGK